MNVESGAIYTATVYPEYVKYAFISAKSLKTTSNIKSTLFVGKKRWHSELAEKLGDDPFIDVVVTSTNKPRTRLASLYMTPYQHTLAMDCDTIVLDNISDIFNILDKYEFCICHAHNRQINYLRYNSYKLGEDIPYAFTQHNGGVILFDRNKEVLNFLKDWHNRYKEYVKKNIPKDQVSMRKMLWKHNLRMYVLPPEYNVNKAKWFKIWEEAEAKPLIFHYTMIETLKENRNIINPIIGPNMSSYIDKVFKIKIKR